MSADYSISLIRNLKTIFLVIISFAVVGCASIPEGEVRSPKDPWEAMNRTTFEFNEKLDKFAIRPATEGYVFIMPTPVRDGISNMISNVLDVPTAVNDLLQGKPKDSLDDLSRVFVNSTLGVAGIFDVASAGGMEKRREDFGQTFATWGFESGPYIVLPLFGASSVRDAVGLGVDILTDPLFQGIKQKTLSNAITAIRFMDVRAKFLEAGDLLDGIVIDKYTFTRDTYFQRRRSLVDEGEVPTYIYDSN
jgi:phospholipid-binding lipoprotein MlaA